MHRTDVGSITEYQVRKSLTKRPHLVTKYIKKLRRSAMMDPARLATPSDQWRWRDNHLFDPTIPSEAQCKAESVQSYEDMLNDSNGNYDTTDEKCTREHAHELSASSSDSSDNVKLRYQKYDDYVFAVTPIQQRSNHFSLTIFLLEILQPQAYN
ncbi:hypothetical protein EYC80_009957 [Monilinia laxa]|uniref:Uncharacterized protein n=1 Tax=Monilinia laxa TaxID=61186 RepID=A0A5N6JSL2_MONLA|nr:hypothetical protein EYC80_009957 [Monilinia laxa]